MLAVTHTLTSAAIGATVESAPVAFALAFLFHLFADTLLHWNIYLERYRWPYVWVMIDVVAGLVIAYLLVPERFFTASVLAAMVGGNFPDVVAGLLELCQRRKGLFFRFHEGLQNETLSPGKGLVWQALLVMLATLLLVRRE